MKKKIVSISILFLLLGFLLLNPSEAATGSKTGLLLWFNSLVPVLLPFMILSKLLISWNGLNFCIRFLQPITGKILGISPMGAYALILGFLCGYPMGAKIISDLVQERSITKEEGGFLLCFCNNVSPAFLIGYTMTEQLHAASLIPLTLLLIYGIPLLLTPLWRKITSCTVRNKLSHKHTSDSSSTSKQTSGFQISFKIVDVCIMNGLESIFKLGCYIILFSMTARLVSSFPFPSILLKGILIGILEITNGIAAVSGLNIAFVIRYLAILGFLTFGGLSGVAQVSSMIQGSGLSLKTYVKAKLITTVVVLILAYVLIKLLPVLPLHC